MTEKSVLTVQSHVVHGYVGNKAATFPLQIRGWDVDALNVVQFSNHTGYGEVHGYKLDSYQVEELYDGIKAQGFEYTAFLTGYIPSADSVEAVGRIGADLKSRFPNAIWLLDPVMGDEGTLYVKQDVIPAYKSLLAAEGLVTLTTPNHFEAELLTDINLASKADVIRALNVFHEEYKIPHVVISSLPDPKNKNELLTVGSTKGGVRFFIRQTKLDSYFTGTGDLFAAILLDNFERFGDSRLADATAATISLVRKVLERTYEYGEEHNVPKTRIQDPSMRYHELRLIQNQGLIASDNGAGIKWETY